MQKRIKTETPVVSAVACDYIEELQKARSDARFHKNIGDHDMLCGLKDDYQPLLEQLTPGSSLVYFVCSEQC
ncbi:unnamed protein product [Gongylonema pulchrum]|uniref:LigA domain-containing protein n=1 Tax=Gongylonema pulchrum TaxID=637853 RepID=A0A183E147_9BILA|nr:unnamed protein product [Gongylonema pulchrum]